MRPHLPWLPLFALLLAACVTDEGSRVATTQRPVPSVPQPVIQAQTFGSNDVFEVRVVGEQDLSGIYRVSSDGSVTFPFCGKVAVDGLNATDLSETLTKCLADGYLKNPQVAVFLKEHNSKKIFVLGEVSKPGTFSFEDNMSVVQAITLAGGFTKLAAKNSVLVTRKIEGAEHRLKVAVDDIGTGRQENLALLPGDIVFVPESFF